MAICKLGLSFAEVREVLGAIRTVCMTHALTIGHDDKGNEIAERYGFSFYDSAMVAWWRVGRADSVFDNP